MTFNSSPEGITVYLDDDIIGKTPLTYSIKRRMAVHEVTFKKEDYKTQYLTLKKSIATAAFFNSTFFLSWGTDALTGKMFEYSPNSYFIDLDSPKTTNAHQEAWKFVMMNYKSIVSDISKNGGEFSKSYCQLMGLDHQQFIKQSKLKLKVILASNSPVKFQEENLALAK